MQEQNIPPELLRATPGALGAIIALRWIPGTPIQRIAAVAGGIAASIYVAPNLAAWLHVDRDLASFLVGLYGMAIASKVFETIAAIDLGKVVERILKRWGL